MAIEHCDIAVVGGGPVGAALALALGDSGFTVAVLEARAESPARDPRVLALSQGTRLILERLAAWRRLEPAATPIEAIHVSQRGRFGRALLAAEEMGVPALGYSVAYGDLQAALAAGLADSGAVTIAGARATAVRPASGCGLVEYQQDGEARSLSARLLVLADGGRSLPGKLEVKDYGQSAVVCTVRCELAHGGRAYERFTPDGPMALLPLGRVGPEVPETVWSSPSPGPAGHPLPLAGEGMYGLVWTTAADDLERRLQLDDAAFLAELQHTFGTRQGRILAAGSRSAFPLRLATSTERERPGLVRIGNAAQTLHPVAGQGFNMGLRDAWWLAQAILDTPRERLGDRDFLARYRDHRYRDVEVGILMTDLLVELFANDLPILSQLRGLVLTAMDVLPPLKQLFARKMMYGAQAW